VRSRPPRQATPGTASSSGTAEGGVPHGRSRAAWLPSARLLLRIDGVFEGVLGALLILSPATRLYARLAPPAPASQPVVVVVGVLLLPLLPILWRFSRAPQWQPLLALAGANSAGALALLVWVVFWHTAFHPAGAAVVLVVAAILFVLDLLQSATAVMMR
jgi:hypothetical protein